MKAKFNLLFTALCLFFVAYNWAQAPQLEWAVSLGDAFEDQGAAIGLDAAGNVYTTGYFKGTVDFDPGPDVYNLSSTGDRDLFIQKLDNQGNFLWAKNIGAQGFFSVNSLAVGPGGNIVITGSFEESIDIEPEPGCCDFTSNGMLDIFILALDWEGNQIWAKQMGGAGTDLGLSVTIDCNDHVLVTGQYEGTVDFNPGAGTCFHTSQGCNDIFLAEFDCAGGFIRTLSMGGSEEDAAFALVANPEEDHFYTTGGFHSEVDFDPGPNTCNLSSMGEEDVFIQKFNTAGDFQWAKCIGGTDYDRGNALSIDNLGNVVLAGSFYEIIDFDTGPGEFLLGTENGGRSLFLIRLNPEGNFLGAIALTPDGGDIAPVSLVIDDAGNNYILGNFAGSVDFDPGLGEHILTTTDEDIDIFLMKVDPLGNLLWVRSLGNSGDDFGSSLALDVEGKLFFTGSFQGIVDFDPTTENFDLVAAGSFDAFITKWSTGVSHGFEAAFPTTCSVFPNPSAGTFILDLGAVYEEVTIEVISLTGRMVQRRHLAQAQTLQMQLEGTPGLYFVKIRNKQGRMATLKMIKT